MFEKRAEERVKKEIKRETDLLWRDKIVEVLRGKVGEVTKNYTAPADSANFYFVLAFARADIEKAKKFLSRWEFVRELRMRCIVPPKVEMVEPYFSELGVVRFTAPPDCFIK